MSLDLEKKTPEHYLVTVRKAVDARSTGTVIFGDAGKVWGNNVTVLVLLPAA